MFLVTENAEQRAEFRKDIESRNQATTHFLEDYQRALNSGRSSKCFSCK